MKYVVVVGLFNIFLEVRYILCLEGIGRDYSKSMMAVNSQKVSLVILYWSQKIFNS